MALITRQAKGSKLTITEMDNNLIFLQDLSNSKVSSIFGRTGAITSQNGDYNVSQITGLQDALDNKQSLLPNQGYVGPSQPYLTIKEAIDDNKTLIEVVGDTTETSDILLSVDGSVTINIYQSVSVNMDNYVFNVTSSDHQLFINCTGTIIWSPTITKNLFNSLNNSVLFINNINLNMTGGTANSCTICEGFISVILKGVHQLDYPDLYGYGYHNSNPINFNDAFIVIRNLNFFPSNIYNCITINGTVKNLVFVGVFSISNSLATINGTLDLLTIIDLSGAGLTYNFDLNGGKIKEFQKLLISGGSINVNIEIRADNSELHNFNMIGPDITSQINVNDYQNISFLNVYANSILNTNITTKQNNVIDLSFSSSSYSRNIKDFYYVLNKDLEYDLSSMTKISNLELTLEEGWYRFEFVAFYNVKDPSFGIGFNFQDTSALIDNYSFVATIPRSVNESHFINCNDPNQDFSVSPTPVLENNRAYMIIEFQVLKPGTIMPHFRSNIDGELISLRAGSYIKVEKLNINI